MTLAAEESHDLLDSAPVMIWRANRSLERDYFNRAWLEFAGMPAVELLRDGWQRLVHPEDLPVYLEKSAAARDGKQPFSLVYRLRCFNGSYRRVALRASPCMDSDGSCSGYVGSCVDMFDLHERHMDTCPEVSAHLVAMEEQCREERFQMLQYRQSAMGEMIHTIAHQWRQPLSTLGLYLEGLAYLKDLESLDREYINKSINNSMTLIQHMSKTIDDFRDFFRPDKEKTGFSIENSVARAIILTHADFYSRQIKVYIYNEKLEMISGYPNEFSQAVLNIIINARDALVANNIEEPKIHIRIFKESGHPVITIGDNAGGIAPEIMNQVFTPHFTTKGENGSGIGLYIAKYIIEKNFGGRLTVCNIPSGAEFRIELPA